MWSRVSPSDIHHVASQGAEELFVINSIKQGQRLEWPSQMETKFFCHDALRELVAMCWRQDPVQRPSVKVALVPLLRRTEPRIRFLTFLV